MTNRSIAIVRGRATIRRTDTQEWHVNTEASYSRVVAAACGDEPAPDFIGVRESDAWVNGDASWQVLYLARGKDFSTMSVEDQRTFLLLAAECLFGPNLDPIMLMDAVIEASEI